MQGHAGLCALVVSGTVAESVVSNLLRTVPLLLQCRGDASLSMVSIIFIGLTLRRGRSFKPDVIRALEMHFDLSHTGEARFLFRFSPRRTASIILRSAINCFRWIAFVVSFCAICFLVVRQIRSKLTLTWTSNVIYWTVWIVIKYAVFVYSDFCVVKIHVQHIRQFYVI